eukprot:5259910-Pyramimonas_sp.AAC.1
MRGVPKWAARTNANAATWAFGGAPYGAANRVRGVPTWAARTNTVKALSKEHLLFKRGSVVP